MIVKGRKINDLLVKSELMWRDIEIMNEFFWKTVNYHLYQKINLPFMWRDREIINEFYFKNYKVTFISQIVFKWTLSLTQPHKIHYIISIYFNEFYKFYILNLRIS